MNHVIKCLRFNLMALVLLSGVVHGAENNAHGYPLHGTIIGTSGSWDNNPWVTKDAVMDGNVRTYFDAPTHDGAWVGLDLGKGKGVRITKIGFYPRLDEDARSQFSRRMVGGVFQGAHASDFSDAVDLFTVQDQPEQGKMTVRPVTTPDSFRYVRYLAPNDSNGNVAEIEFYSDQLVGTVIGTPGSWADNPKVNKDAVFDGLVDTFFDAREITGAWVGLDLGAGESAVVTRIAFFPRKDDDAKSNYSNRMVGGKFQGANTADFSDAVDLFVVEQPPGQNKWTEVTVVHRTQVRYVRYVSPAGGSCNVAELEFFGELSRGSH